MNSLRSLGCKSFCRYFATVKRFQFPQRNQKLEVSKSEKTEHIPTKTKLDADTIALLERLSLVDCMSKEEIKTLEDSIDFANKILDIDTTGVEPLITVLEDYPLVLREDVVTEGNCRDAILKNAAVTEEEYFVAPPGNIPIENREDLLYESDTKTKPKS